MKTVEIPGGVAHLREPAEIRVRHKRPIEAASLGAAAVLAKLPGDQEKLEALDMSELGLTSAESILLFELQDATILGVLASWTLDEPIPTVDTIGDMRPAVYEALALATRETGAAIAKGVDFDPPDPKSPEMEGSPTVRSADSDNGLSAKTEAESESISAPSSNGTSLRSVEPSPDAAMRTT